MCARVYGSMIDARRGVVIIASAGVILCMHYVMHVHRPRTTIQLIENRQCRALITIPGFGIYIPIANSLWI